MRCQSFFTNFHNIFIVYKYDILMFLYKNALHNTGRIYFTLQ